MLIPCRFIYSPLLTRTNSKEKRVSIIKADSRFVPSQWVTAILCNDVSHWLGASLEWDDSMLAPRQWEMVLLCNDVSHWLGASLESDLIMYIDITWESWSLKSPSPSLYVRNVTFIRVMVSQITNNSTICSIVCIDHQRRKHQSSTLLSTHTRTVMWNGTRFCCRMFCPRWHYEFTDTSLIPVTKGQ